MSAAALRRLVAIGVMTGAVLHARAARAQPSGPLEIDQCPARTLTKKAALKEAEVRFDRGVTLYLQGDYEAAIAEFLVAHCLEPSSYTVLKDIGQAYERLLDYEKAIGYFERFVRAVPTSARADTAPQQDKVTVTNRIEVLRKLRAKVYVESSPPGARITIANASGVAARASAGETLEVLGGRYELTTELDGYLPHRQSIDVRIGKPYTYFVPMVAQKGRLALRTVPHDARIFIGDRLAGIGSVDTELEGNSYVVTIEATDRITERRQVEVIANQVQRVQVELLPKPQLGRRQLIGFAAAAGASSGGSLLYAFQDTGVSALGTLGGAAAGFFGGVFLLPSDLSLATSNLTITSTIGGAVLGLGATLLFTERAEIVQPVIGATTIAGGALGYVLAERTQLSTGDAAVINSGMLWGSAAGGLLALSFDPDHTVAAGLVLSGLGMGTIGGLLLQQNFSISRTHAALIDVGGLVGMIGGLAAESLAYPTQSMGDEQTVDARAQEHLANFALGGMAVGLITAGILTRDMDAPKLPVGPAVTQATTRDGRSVAVYGITGSW